MPSSSAIGLPELVITAQSPHHQTSFRELVSELNPLQYLPVIGPLYRAVTGDTIPESARTVGSVVVSGLLGGPIGIATSLGFLAVEKLTGIDPEKIGHDVAASLGIGSHEGGTLAAVTAAQSAAAPTESSAASGLGSVAWSQAQLTAYGVTTTAGGTLKRGDLEGSDVLNDMELTQLVAFRSASSSSVPNA